MMNSFKRKITYTIISLATLFWLSACATGGASDGKESVATGSDTTSENKNNQGTLLIFSEREAGSASYTARIFINSKFIRISDSFSPADFILFNRAERTIYNVTHDEKTILVIQNRSHDIKPPIEIKYDEESQPSSAIPKINGRQATHYRYFANGKRCYDSVVLGEEFMPDVLAAMREFRQVLANEHAFSVNNMPRDMMDACEMAVNVFFATRHMDHGLPIREWDTKGYQRFLKDYRENISVPANSFELPKNYIRFSTSDAPPIIGR